MAGFQFDETMQGSFRMLRETDGGPMPGEPKAIRFRARARVGSMLRHLADRKAELDGEVDMEGLATGKAMHGELTIDPLLGRKVVYDFEFEGDDGGRYRFAGQKDVRLLDLLHTMTTLPADITDETGRRVATAELRFDTRDLPSFLLSFRPHL